MILRTWLLRVVPGCHSDEYASARSLQWHSGLKRSGYDVRILGVYKLLDGSLSTGLRVAGDGGWVSEKMNRQIYHHRIHSNRSVAKQVSDFYIQEHGFASRPCAGAWYRLVLEPSV